MNSKLLFIIILLIASINRAGSGPIPCAVCLEKTTTACGMALSAVGHCSGLGWCPPLWGSCVTALVGVVCGTAMIGCAWACLAPTP